MKKCKYIRLACTVPGIRVPGTSIHKQREEILMASSSKGFLQWAGDDRFSFSYRYLQRTTGSHGKVLLGIPFAYKYLVHGHG